MLRKGRGGADGSGRRRTRATDEFFRLTSPGIRRERGSICEDESRDDTRSLARLAVRGEDPDLERRRRAQGQNDFRRVLGSEPQRTQIARIALDGPPVRRLGLRDAVVRGQKLVVLRAMKMETAVTAEADGRIAEVLVTPGTQVEAGDLLLVFEG